MACKMSVCNSGPQERPCMHSMIDHKLRLRSSKAHCIMYPSFSLDPTSPFDDMFDAPDLGNVVNQQLDSLDLVQCTLVNSIWYDVAMPYLWQKISKVRSQAQQHALQRFILNRSYPRAAASTTTTTERTKDRSRHRHCPEEVPVSSLCFDLQIIGIQPFRFN